MNGAVAIVVALIGAGGTLGAVWLGRKVKQIHVLVNGRLAEALAEIEQLKRELADVEEHRR